MSATLDIRHQERQTVVGRQSLTRIAAYALALSTAPWCRHSDSPYAQTPHCTTTVFATTLSMLPSPCRGYPSSQSDFLPTDFVIFAEYRGNIQGCAAVAGGLRDAGCGSSLNTL